MTSLFLFFNVFPFKMFLTSFEATAIKTVDFSSGPYFYTKLFWRVVFTEVIFICHRCAEWYQQCELWDGQALIQTQRKGLYSMLSTGSISPFRREMGPSTFPSSNVQRESIGIHKEEMYSSLEVLPSSCSQALMASSGAFHCHPLFFPRSLVPHRKV